MHGGIIIFSTLSFLTFSGILIFHLLKKHMEKVFGVSNDLILVISFIFGIATPNLLFFLLTVFLQATK